MSRIISANSFAMLFVSLSILSCWSTAQVPEATVRSWNITNLVGHNATEIRADHLGLTRHVAEEKATLSLVTNCEIGYATKLACLVFWNPSTNLFKWYSLGPGFSPSLDINLWAPKFSDKDGQKFAPGDVWVTVREPRLLGLGIGEQNGQELCTFCDHIIDYDELDHLQVNFVGSDQFRVYRFPGAQLNGVRVNQSTGWVYFTDLSHGVIYQLDPATHTITSWRIGGYPYYLVLDESGYIYSAVALTTVAGGRDAIVRIDPNASKDNLMVWPISTGLASGIKQEAPNGLSFDTAGRLWFNRSAANDVARLDLNSNELCLYRHSQIDNPQLIASSGSEDQLQTFSAELQGGAVTIITQARATPTCAEAAPMTLTIETVTATQAYRDLQRSPVQRTIEPGIATVGGDESNGIIRYAPLPVPPQGCISVPRKVAGITGAILPNTVFGTYLPHSCNNGAVFQLTSKTIIAEP